MSDKYLLEFVDNSWIASERAKRDTMFKISIHNNHKLDTAVYSLIFDYINKALSYVLVKEDIFLHVLHTINEKNFRQTALDDVNCELQKTFNIRENIFRLDAIGFVFDLRLLKQHISFDYFVGYLRLHCN